MLNDNPKICQFPYCNKTATHHVFHYWRGYLFFFCIDHAKEVQPARYPESFMKKQVIKKRCSL